MVVISDEILEATKLTEQEILIELALMLYQQGRLSFGQARQLAGMEYFEFEKLLADRKVPPSYTAEDLREDVLTLQKLRGQHGRHQ